MSKIILWLVPIGLVLLFIGYPLTDLLGPIFIMLLAIAGFLTALGHKGGIKLFGQIILGLVVLLIMTPFFYSLITATALQTIYTLHRTGPSSSIALLVGLIVFVLLLAGIIFRIRLSRTNSQGRRKFEESMSRRARISARRRAIPDNLGWDD